MKKKIECYQDNDCLIVTSHTRGKQNYNRIVRNGKQWLLHRWVFYNLHGFLPEEVMHSCDNTHCINPSHLLAGNRQENERDKVLKGRALFGEKNPQCKLKEKEVISIQKSIIDGVSLSLLAKKFSVSVATISHIRDGNSWKYIFNPSTKGIKFSRKGERNSNHKLINKDIKKIRTLLKIGKSKEYLVDKFKVCPSTISHIKCGRTWNDNEKAKENVFR